MTKVNCTISNCSFYNNNVCYADCVRIGGQGSTEEAQTCCGTFHNKAAYSNLADHTDYQNVCEVVSCNVATCRHNADETCQLGCIQVNGDTQAQYYTFTDCSNFEKK